MGHIGSAVIAAAGAAVLAGCGDPLVVIGDAPGIVRVVAGTPELPGSRLGAQATESQLNGPRGVAASADGMLYIADHENARILAVDLSARVLALVDGNSGGGEPGLSGPDGIALDGQGGLLIADSRGHRVWRLELATVRLALIAGTGTRGSSPDSIDAVEADLETPTGIAVGSDGEVYFSEFSGHRVRRIEPDGSLITIAGTGIPTFGGDGGPARNASLERPAGLAIGDRVLYIADGGNHRVRAVDLETGLIGTVAGAGGAGSRGDGGPAVDALLDDPADVTLSQSRRILFIADRHNHRVRVVNLAAGTIETFIGDGTEEFRGDLLQAGEYSLRVPRGLTVSPLDVLYISDTGHHVVVRTPVAFLATP